MKNRSFSSTNRQRGVALFVVIVFVMLSMLLALWASRTSFFNEMVVGNDADYQRAFEAAQALLQDAELDIRGAKADGTECLSVGTDICRSSTAEKIPLEAQEVGPLLSRLSAASKRCSNGLCAKRLGRQDFWNYMTTASPAPDDLQVYEKALDELTVQGVGARYGQYTGALSGDASAPANPLLQWNSASPADQGGWYWIEVLPYNMSSQMSGVIVEDAASSVLPILPLNLIPAVVYRITAIAYGRKPGTMVVLQETYARSKRKD